MVVLTLAGMCTNGFACCRSSGDLDCLDIFFLLLSAEDACFLNGASLCALDFSLSLLLCVFMQSFGLDI